ncbi:MAG: hypothetical protein ACQER9_01030 [Nanobdellota archaeon]
MKNNPNSELVKYIWKNLQNGFSLTSIRKQLTSQGISFQDINNAFDFIYANYYYSKNRDDYRNYSKQRMKPSKKLPKHDNKMVFALFTIIGVLLIGFSAVFVLWDNSQENDVLSDNEEIGFDKGVEEKTEENDDVTEKKNNKEEHVVNDDNNNKDSQVKTNLDDFQKEEDVEEDTINKRLNESNYYNNRQIKESVNYYSTNDPKKAIEYCNKYELKEKINFCYKSVAVKSKNSAYCKDISMENIKDDCYLDFVIEGSTDDSYCKEVKQENKKNNCFRLVDLNKELEEAESLSNKTDANIEEMEQTNESEYGVVADFY